jgi:hypothetical protein
MRAAIMETVKEHTHPGLLQGGAALRVSGSDARAGRDADRESQHRKQPESLTMDKRDGETAGGIFIKEEACYVMARACELFAMDLAKRSELVMQDAKRARSGSAWMRHALPC